MPSVLPEEPLTLSDDQIHEAITRLIASGKLEIQIDDSDLRASIATVAKDAKGQIDAAQKRLLDAVTVELGKRPTGEAVTAALGSLAANIEKAHAANVADLESRLSRTKPTAANFNEAKLRQIADEVAQTLLTAAVVKEIATGAKVPLPPLLKPDPYFVENEQTDRIAHCLDTKRHAMLSGPSGAGKTYPVEMVLRKRGLRYRKVSVADGLTLSDFLCRAHVRATAHGSETYYSHGFLPFTMLNGLPLLLDEIDQCQPEIVSILNAALEARSIYLPQTGETVTAAPGWQVFMTCNTLRDTTGNYAGFRLNAALLNRVVFVKADYLEPKDENAILQRVGLTQKDAAVIVGLMQGLRNAYATGKLTQAPSTRIAVRVARCVLGQDDDGAKCAAPMKLVEAFAFCLLDGLPDNEVKEALAVLKAGL